ncbi:rhodanese-like domain-containing protein [Belliella pelovolcani]|uniref:Rhodanese-related sulfurtransferase n=1 Tax=Belliella pelovolcani TaxID=529505 RepID=A0A1N7PNP6_9BACT|nr:rhodanese-like domain-containing protein [Belliella pelovolcani]SIT12097.1 Rhodanese-related sulfurtransferase [Belliella pelovolcani]
MQNQIKHYQEKLSYEMDSADLFEALQKGEKISAIDARKVEGYNLEHIPGAISLPHRNMNESTTAHLDKNILYVTYCDGIGCNASTFGALKMAQLGFKVKELIGGLDWWKRDGYSTEGEKAVITNQMVKCYC